MLVATAPLTVRGPAHQALSLVLWPFVFAACLWAVWPILKIRIAALAVGVPALFSLVLDTIVPGHPAARWLMIFGSAFFILVLARVLRRVVDVTTVTEDSLYGAGSVYLLIGLAWSIAYYAVSRVLPGAFNLSDARAGSVTTWPDFVYFSFTTLSTVGYGDILAVAPLVRSMVILEVITGVFFVAVIISRLVSMYRPR